MHRFTVTLSYTIDGRLKYCGEDREEFFYHAPWGDVTMATIYWCSSRLLHSSNLSVPRNLSWPLTLQSMCDHNGFHSNRGACGGDLNPYEPCHLSLTGPAPSLWHRKYPCALTDAWIALTFRDSSWCLERKLFSVSSYLPLNLSHTHTQTSNTYCDWSPWFSRNCTALSEKLANPIMRGKNR